MSNRSHPWDRIEWAIRSVPPDRGRCLAVLMAIVLHANAKGRCHPGIALLAEIVFDQEPSTADQRDRVRRALRWLESAGLLTTTEIPGRGNVYQLATLRHDDRARPENGDCDTPRHDDETPRSQDDTPRHDDRRPPVAMTGLTTRTANGRPENGQGAALLALQARMRGVA